MGIGQVKMAQNLLFKKNNFLMFYLFLRERERQTDRDRASVGVEQREKGTQNPKQAPGSRLPAVSTGPDVGLELRNREIMT